jgi:hypothetical protein
MRGIFPLRAWMKCLQMSLASHVGWDEIPAWIGMAMLGFHPSLQTAEFAG